MSNEIKSGVINSLVVEGHTYHNIVPENPTLRNSVYHKYMQRFNYGYDDAIVKEADLNYAFMYGDTMINIASERRNSYIGNTVKRYQTQKISQEHDIVYILNGLNYNAVVKGETIKYILPESKCFKVDGTDEITHFVVSEKAIMKNQVLSYKNELNGSFSKDVVYTLYVPHIGDRLRNIKLEVSNGEVYIERTGDEYILFHFTVISEKTVLKLVQEFPFTNEVKDVLVSYVTQDVVVVEGDYFDIPLQILDGGLHSISLEHFTIKTTGKNLLNEHAIVLGYVTEDGRIDDEGDPFIGVDEAQNYMRTETIQVIPNKTYTISIESDIISSLYRPVWSWFDKEGNLIRQDKTMQDERILTATAPEKAQFVIVHIPIKNNEGSNIVLVDHISKAQLEEGNKATQYDAYKENTIYLKPTLVEENGVIKEVYPELHSIGDIYDELDLNRSVITRRIKKVLDDEGQVILRKVIHEYEEPVEIASTGNIVKIDIKKYVDDSSWDIEKLQDGFQIRLKALEGTILDNLINNGYFEIESNDEEIFYKENIILNEEKNGTRYAISIKVPKDSRAFKIFTQDNIDDMELYYIKWMNHILPDLDVVIWCESDTRYLLNVNELLSFENGYLMFNPIRRAAVHETNINGNTTLIGYENVGCRPTIPTVSIEMPAANAFYLNMLKPDTYYTLSNYGESNYVIIDHEIIDIVDGAFKTPEELEVKMIIFEKIPSTQEYIMIVEGDHAGKTIPFFNGSLSVSNPQVKVVGRNLYNPDKNGFIKVQPGENYIKYYKSGNTFKVCSATVRFYTDNNPELDHIDEATAFSFYVHKDAKYIKFDNVEQSVQLEQRLIDDLSYKVDPNTGIISGISLNNVESYSETKVNLKNYTMRSIGEIRDIYDIQNGIFVKNVGEVEFKGIAANGWKLDSKTDRYSLYKLPVEILNGKINNDKFTTEVSTDESCVYYKNGNIYVYLLTKDIEKVQEEYIKIYYAIAEPVRENPSNVRIISKNGGSISVDVNNSLLPLISYEVVTENSFHIDALRCNKDIENGSTRYTLRWDNGSTTDTMTFSLNGLKPYTISYDGIIDLPNTIDKVMIVENLNNRKPMLILGDVRGLKLPNYFIGIRTSSDEKNEIKLTLNNLQNNSKTANVILSHTNKLALASLPNNKQEEVVVNIVNNLAIFKRITHKFIINVDSEIKDVKPSEIHGYTHVIIPLPKAGINNLFCDKLDVSYYYNDYIFIDENGINIVTDSSFVWDRDTFKNYLKSKPGHELVILYELAQPEVVKLTDNNFELLEATKNTKISVNSTEFPFMDISAYQVNRPTINNAAEGTPLVHVVQENEELQTNAIVKPVLSLRGKKYKVKVKPDTEYTISFKASGVEGKLLFDLAGSEFEYDSNNPKTVIIKTPKDELKHNYLYIKGGRCKISEVTVVENYVLDKYFESVNSVGLFENNTLKIVSDNRYDEIKLPTDLRSVGSEEDVYLPDKGLVRQYINKKELNSGSLFTNKGIDEECHVYQLKENIDAKASDIVYCGMLLPDLGEKCTIEEGNLIIRFSIYRKESFTEFLASNTITIYYAVNTPNELTLESYDLTIKNTETFSSNNEISPVFTFRSNAFFNVNLEPDKDYIISCICPSEKVKILTSTNTEEFIVMDKDVNSNLHTKVLKGSEIGTSFDFDIDTQDLRNIMVTEVDSDQPYSTNMISGITPFNIAVGSLNLVDIDNANLIYSESLTVARDDKVIYVENNDCVEETTNIVIPIADGFEKMEGYYIASFKINDLQYSDNNRIKHRFTVKMIDLYGNKVGISTNYLLDEEGELVSDPFKVVKGNFITGIVIEDEMVLSNDTISLVNAISYNISEVVVRYFDSLEDTENYKHKPIDFVDYVQIPVNFDKPLYALSNTVYDVINYQDQVVVRNIGTHTFNSNKATITYNAEQKVYNVVFSDKITDAQVNCKYVFSSLPVGDANSNYSCAYFNHNTGVVNAKIYQDVTSDVNTWLDNSPGLTMLHQLDVATTESFANLGIEKPHVNVPINAGISSIGSKVKPVLDWNSEQIKVNISSADVYTVIFEVLNKPTTGNVFIGPNVTKNCNLKLGTNRVAVKVDPTTINECNFVELDFPSAKIGKVMVVPGNFEDIDNGDQLQNVLYEHGLFESVGEADNYAISIVTDAGTEYTLDNMPYSLKGLPNHVYDEILFSNGVGSLIKRIGQFELTANSSVSINENRETDMYEVIINDLPIHDSDNFGNSVLCKDLPVIDSKYNPTKECITNVVKNGENCLQIQIPFTTLNKYSGSNLSNKIKNYIKEKEIIIIYQLTQEEVIEEFIYENYLVLKEGDTTISSPNYIPPYVQYIGIDYDFEEGTIKEDTPYTIIFTADGDLATVDNIMVSLCGETKLIKLLDGINVYKVIITPEYTKQPDLIISAKGAKISNIMVFEGDYSADKHTPTKFIIGKQSVGVETSKNSGIYRVKINSLEFFIDSPLQRIQTDDGEVFDSIEFDLLTRKYYHIKRISQDGEVLEKPIFVALDMDTYQLLLNKGEKNIIESEEAVKAPFVLAPLEYHLNVKPNTNYKLTFIGKINSSALKVRFNGVTIKTIKGTGQAELYTIPFCTDSLTKGATLLFEKVTTLDNMSLDKIQYVRVFEVTTASQQRAVNQAPTLNVNGIQSAGENGEINLVSYDKNLFDINSLNEENIPSIEYIIRDSGVIRSKPLNSFDVFSLVDEAYTPNGEKGCVAKLPHILPNVDYVLSFDLHAVDGAGSINDISIVGYIADNIDDNDIKGIKIASSKTLPISTEVTNYMCTFKSAYEVHGLGFTITMADNTQNIVLEIEKIQLERGVVSSEYERCNKIQQAILLADPLRSLPDGTCDILTEGSIERKTAMVRFNSEDWSVIQTDDGFTNMYAYINVYKNPTPVPSIEEPNSFICNVPITFDFAPGIIGNVQIEKENDKFRLVASYNGIIDPVLITNVLERYPIILIYKIDTAVLRNKTFRFPKVSPEMEQQIVTNGQLSLTVYDAVRPFITADIPVDTNTVVEEYKQEVKELKEEVANLRDLNEIIMNEYRQYVKQQVLEQSAPLYSVLNVLVNHSLLYDYDEDGEQIVLFTRLFGPFFVQQIKSGITPREEVEATYKEYDYFLAYLVEQLDLDE